MRHIIKFTDGFEIELLNEIDIEKFNSYGVKNALFFYKKATESAYSHPMFSRKTDLDGNVWELIESEHRLKIYRAGTTSIIINVQFSGGSGTYTTYIWGGFCYIDNLGRLKFTSEATSAATGFDGYDKDGNNLYDLIARYPNVYRFNFLSNNSYVYYSGNRGAISFGGSVASLSDFPNSYQILPDITDPYAPGGNSTFGGGGGTFADTSDTMDFPTVPYFEVPDAGFVKLYKATIAQLKSLSAYMWTTFDLTAFKKIFADPMDCILGLTMFRLPVPTSGTENIYVGNIDTGIAVNTVSSQYYELDCGSLEIKEFWGAYLDYSPFTKFEIYLPYIGTRSINADEIMGKTIQLKYHIDLLSGACVAYLKSGDAVLYSWAGQCSANVPLTSRDWTNTVNSLIRIASDVAFIAGGGNPVAGISDMASSAINAVKPDIEKAGNISGTAGLLGIQKPYLIITRPKQALPEQQNVYAGYPAYVTVTLSDISGYCEVDKIHLENIPCTDAELTEIESLLKGGVIL